MRTLIATLIALMLFATTPVAAGDYEDGLTAYRVGDYQKAFRLFKPLAEQGHVEAQGTLGYMYLKGWGVPKDATKAVYWHTKAAEQGSVPAQYNLGSFYAQGVSVPQNDAKAVYWTTKAAKQGHATAQYNLGHIYKQVSRTVTTHSSQHLPLCSHIGPGQMTTIFSLLSSASQPMGRLDR